MNWKKIWKWVEHNRFTVAIPIIGLGVWLIAVGCTPETLSPLTNRMVNASQLQIDFDTMMASFEFAKADLERQALMQAEFTKAILMLASGSVADLPGLLQLLLGSGLLGFAADNIRKNGVIGGLKRNKYLE